MRRFRLSPIPSILLLFLMLSACRSAVPSPQPPSPAQPTGHQNTPTPIPNLRSEAVLDGTFGRAILHLAEAQALVPPAELQAGVKEHDALLLDVRQPLEVREQGFISGAVVIPLRELAMKTSILPDYSQPIYAYCGDGRRCAIVQAGLGVFGWEVRCLEGGFEAWVAAGEPVEHGNPPYPEIDPMKPAFPCCGIYEVGEDYDELQKADPNAPDPALVSAVVRLFRNVPDDYGLISVQDLQSALQSSSPLTILDLRPETPPDSDLSSQPGYRHIPFLELIDQKDRWPQDRAAPLVILAGDDHTAVLAQSLLWAYGFLDVQTLPGGWEAWSQAGGL